MVPYLCHNREDSHGVGVHVELEVTGPGQKGTHRDHTDGQDQQVGRKRFLFDELNVLCCAKKFFSST